MAPPVVVVGSVNVDLVVQVARLPAPGETVTGGTFTRTLGGKGANQAAAAAKLGARTALIGLTGRDDLGGLVREDLGSLGIDLSGLGESTAATGIATIMVDEDGENLIAVAPGANHELRAEAVATHLPRLAGPGGVILSVLELADEAVLEAARLAGELGCRFVLNPAPARPLPDELLDRCDVLTPNEGEAEFLGGPDALLARRVGAAVVTRGAGGADLHRSGAEPYHRDAHPVDVVDTTGAGDAFNGTLAWALVEGRSLEEAVDLAVVGGALATRALGARAGYADREELEGVVR